MEANEMEIGEIITGCVIVLLAALIITATWSPQITSTTTWRALYLFAIIAGFVTAVVWIAGLSLINRQE